MMLQKLKYFNFLKWGMILTKAQLQESLDKANEKITQLEAELLQLRPLTMVVAEQKKTIWALQTVIATYKGAMPQTDIQSITLQETSEDKKELLSSKDGMYRVYCDGACINNGSQRAPGGWAAVVIEPDGKENEYHSGIVSTTNNRMELTAAIEGLSATPKGAKVTLISDSKYVIDGLRKGWAKSWRRNGWMKSDGHEAMNPDLWDQLLKLAEGRQMTYLWVKGHSGNKYNERCDRLAADEATRQH